MILLPVSFRYLIKAFIKPNCYLSFLIFPFTYSYLFQCGFYNFCFAFIPLFVTLGYWFRIDHRRFRKGTVGILFLLISCTYFAHGMIFGILCAFLAMDIVFHMVRAKFSPELLKNEVIHKILALTIATVPSLILFAWTLSRVDFGSSGEKYPFHELLRWIYTLRPLVIFTTAEFGRTVILVLSFLGILIISLSVRIKSLFFSKPSEHDNQAWWRLLRYSDIFIAFALIVLWLFIKVPNGASAGMMSDRLILIFFMFLIVWLSIQTVPRWLVWVVFVLITGAHVSLLMERWKSYSSFSDIAGEIAGNSKYLKNGSVILTINFSDNWFLGHSADYMGIDKPLVLLDNYEPVRSTFPVVWNTDQMPAINFGNKTEIKDYWWMSGKKNTKFKKIDNILVIGDMSNLNGEKWKCVLMELSGSYTLISTDKVHFINLFGLKQGSPMVRNDNQ